MQSAVILAGGRGLRLRPLTDAIPKPMVNINFKPFLLHQVEMLRENNLSDFIFCVGYLNEKVIEYFRDGSRFKVSVKYSIEDKFLGTGGALKNAEAMLPDRFILLYGDSYLPIDYSNLTAFCSKNDYMGVVVCYGNNVRIAQNNIYLDKDGFITRYDKRNPGKDMNYVEAGVLVLKKEILKLIPGGRAVSLEEEIFPLLIKQGQLAGYPTNQRYYDIGTQAGIRQLEEVLK